MRKRIVKPGRGKSLQISSEFIDKPVQVTKKTDFRTKKKTEIFKTELSDGQGAVEEKTSPKKKD